MLILGIDPGLATIGFGLVMKNGDKYRAIEYGAITTAPKQMIEKRLDEIYDSMVEILTKYKPDCMAIEEIFFNNNITTAIDVSMARGVILLAAYKCGVDIYEYTPLEVKSSVVGYGRAEKQQIQYMVRLMLNLNETPKPDDTADALALALCHGMRTNGYN
ncbi:MAG: crossover junction endodeoxyribonuclease RuvC [Clostridia bacterium]|nr:crossover junction endodeoxyribonuclease RuvC [Clostridia bacterium]MBR6783872.1 crossover junction endodeoxyribonuclease RuvC [Clostridia bacterium]